MTDGHSAGQHTGGLFYLYFASKEELVLALQEQYSHELGERMRTAAGIRQDWVARLDACVEAAVVCYREMQDLHEVLFHHARAARPDRGSGLSGAAPAAPAAAAAVVRDLLAAGTAAGAFDVADPGTTAVLCCASLHAFDQGFRGPDEPDDAQLTRAARQLFRRAAGVT